MRRTLAGRKRAQRATYRGRAKPVPVPRVGERQAEVTAENLKAFLNRDWAAVRRSKDRSMREWVERHGPTAAFNLAQGMLEQVWANYLRLRSSDITGLLELRRKMDRANARRAQAAR